MKTYLLVLFFFLLAFVGLGVGLLLKGRGLRGGCGHDRDAEHSCHCESDGHQGECKQDKKSP